MDWHILDCIDNAPSWLVLLLSTGFVWQNCWQDLAECRTVEDIVLVLDQNDLLYDGGDLYAD